MKNSTFKLIAFFLGYSKTIVILSVITGVIAGGSSAVLMTIINARITGISTNSYNSVRAFIGFALLALLSTTASGLLSTRLAQQTNLRLRMDICRRILDTPLRHMEEIGAHRILAALTQDIPTLINAFLRVPALVINVAIVAGCLLYLGVLSPVTLLVLVLFVVFGVLSYVLPQRYANAYMKKARDEYDTLVRHFRSMIKGAKELKLHSRRRDEFFSEVVQPTARALRRHSYVGGNIYVLLNSWSQILYFIIIGLILFALPGLVSNVSPSVLIGYALTVLYMSGYIQALVGIVPAVSNAGISLKKLEALGLSLTESEASGPAADEPPAQANWRSLDLLGVTHTYYREKESSHFEFGPIDLTLYPGELVFVVGGNGSGKTTFVKLLCGLYIPEAGEVRMDGEPVVDDIRDQYRQYFSVVFTEFHLFEQMLGLHSPDLDAVARRYLAQLDLDHKVEILDGKLSTTDLSYGQRKRLALLTAYLEDRPLYIFDEWAADQDPVFKEIFYLNLLPELKARGKTVIVISHDDRYYHVADRVIKLDYGKLVYDGYVIDSGNEPAEAVTLIGNVALAAHNAPAGRGTPFRAGGVGVLEPAPHGLRPRASALETLPGGSPGGAAGKNNGHGGAATPPRRRAAPTAKNISLSLLSCLFVAALALLSVYRQSPPRAVNADAPLEQFASGRAMRRLQAIAAKPRPAGSAAHAEVRGYIVQSLAGMGLDPQIQRAEVIKKGRSGSSVGGVQNVLARLGGAEPGGKAVMLVAHYDSVAQSPGASDDGTGVVTLLETLRALKTGPPLKNDLIFLFTDGEELGLMGARAFVNEHPWAKDVGVVLNFEARGSGGPVYMFETSEKNGWLVNQFAQAAPHPSASSLMYAAYKLLPNDTDMTVFKGAGMAGLNFAHIGGARDYHNARDSVTALDERSLQHHGSYALSLARQLGGASLSDARAGDAVYFDLLGLLFVHYPEALTAPLAVLLWALFAGAVFFGFKRKRLTARGTAGGLSVFVLSLVCSAGVMTLAGWGIKQLHPAYTSQTNAGLYVAGFAALTLGITLTLYLLFLGRTSLNDLTAGGLLGVSVLNTLVCIFLPAASYLTTWPLLFGLLAFGLTMLYRKSEADAPKWVLLGFACAAPGVVLLSGTAYNLFQGLGLGLPALLTILEVTLLGLLAPLLGYVATPYRWLLPSASLLVGVTLLFVGHVTPTYGEHNPKTDAVFYSVDADKGEALWVSSDGAVDEWTAQFFPGKLERRLLPNHFPGGQKQLLASPAPLAGLPDDQLTILEEKADGDVLTLRMRVVPRPNARTLYVTVSPETEVLSGRVNGKPLEFVRPAQGQEQSAAGWELTYLAVPPEGFDLVLDVRTKPEGGVKLYLTSYTDGLPELSNVQYKKRPGNLMPAANSDTTRVIRSITLAAAPKRVAGL